MYPCGDERTPPPILSQQGGEVQGSLISEVRVKMRAALTTTERVGTTRRTGSG